MSLNIQKTKEKVIIEINKKERSVQNIIFVILTVLFILLGFFLFFRVPQDQRYLVLIIYPFIFILLVIVNIINFRTKFFIEKDLLKKQFRLVMPLSFPLGLPASLIQYKIIDEEINESLLYVGASKVEGYFAGVEKIYTLILFFDNRKRVLFSPESFALGSTNGSSYYRVTKKEAETIAKELGVRIKFI